MSEILEDFSPPALITAIEANAVETFTRLGHTPRGQLQESPEVLWYNTGVTQSFYNMVVRAHFEPAVVDQRIEETMQHFKARQAPMSWFLGPTTRPADLGRHLEAHGLSYAGDDPGMAVDLRTLNANLAAAAGLSIRRVSEAEVLEQWIEAYLAGYELTGVTVQELLDVHAPLGLGENPPWQHYLGFLNGKPVATSWLSVGGGEAGIYGVATLPEARRQGIGAALTLAPLLDACAMGYRIGILQSSVMGYNVYRGLGFQEYCKFSVYSCTTHRCVP